MNSFIPSTPAQAMAAYGAVSGALSGFYRKDPDDGYVYKIEGTSVVIVKSPNSGITTLIPNASQTAAILEEIRRVGVKTSDPTSGGGGGGGITDSAFFWPGVILGVGGALVGGVLYVRHRRRKAQGA